MVAEKSLLQRMMVGNFAASKKLNDLNTWKQK